MASVRIPQAATNLKTLQSAVAATGIGVSLETIGHSGAVFDVIISDTATVTFEQTTDGMTYRELQVANSADGTVSTTATASGTYVASVSGCENVRGRVSAYTGGTVTVKARAVPNAPSIALADVEASISGVGEINLDAADDEVAVYGSDDGGTTRIIVKTDAGGAVQIGDNSASLTVDNPTLSVVGGGAEATAQRVTLSDESLAGLEAVTVQNASGASAVNVQDGGNSLTVDNAALSVVGGGTEATAQRVTIASDSTGVISVDDNSSSLTVDGTVAATQSGSWTAAVAGDVAHDASDSGNPVKVGGKAVAHGATPTEVAANDRTQWYFNRAGVPFVIGGHPNVVSISATYTSAQTDTALVTVGASSKIVVTAVMVTCSAANTVNTSFRMGFGTANTPATASIVARHPGIPAGAGFTRGDGSGILGVGADNEDLRLTCSVPTGGAIDVVVSYYLVGS